MSKAYWFNQSWLNLNKPHIIFISPIEIQEISCQKFKRWQSAIQYYAKTTLSIRTLKRTLKFHSLKIKQLFQIITLVNMRLNAPETTVVCQIRINTILNYNPIYEKVFRNTFYSAHCYAVSREICVTQTTFLGCWMHQNSPNT